MPLPSFQTFETTEPTFRYLIIHSSIIRCSRFPPVISKPDPSRGSTHFAPTNGLEFIGWVDEHRNAFDPAILQHRSDLPPSLPQQTDEPVSKNPLME